jgi:membrane fusion protein (multidrug efflux system)
MRYVITIAALVLLVGALAGVKGAQISTLIGFGEQMEKLGPPPESVNSARAEKQDWEQTLSAVGTVVSGKGVAVSNDAPGVVSKLRLESGKPVKAGEVLVELDASVERAQIESLRARLKLAQQSLDRIKTLQKSGVSTAAELDEQNSAVSSLSADLKAIQAQIEKKTVRAPFDGVLGIRAVNLGQYLPPGTTVAVLESADSGFVDFTLPQQDLRKLKLGQPVRVRPDANDPQLAEGTISALEPALDAVTRNVKVRASFPGSESLLAPGMFVNVDVILPEKSTVLSVPLTAVVHAAYGDSVFVVDTKQEGAAGKAGEPEGAGPSSPAPLVARQAFVKLGRTRGDYVAILDGISVGDEIVSSGAFKLRNGAPIAIKNEVQAKPELDPHPANR